VGDLGTLVLLRGNSGSGKSTVARMLQAIFDRATCLVVSQDQVRRDMLRELDVMGGANVELIESIALWGLQRDLVVIVEGIFDVRRYEAMLERLADRALRSLFFAWDLDFEETTRRHSERPQRDHFTVEEMADWYHGWQPLGFVNETRFDASVSADEAVAVISGKLPRPRG
jgi:energy-coupling factor transporter ATP-binding protein EcfA2